MVHFDQKLPEEIELEQKLEELALLRRQHEEARTALGKLEEEINRFAKIYQRTLGRRIEELERLENEIARLTGFYDPTYGYEEQEPTPSAGAAGSSEASGPAGSARGDAKDGFSAKKAEQAGKGRDRDEEQDIKALYREVAKAIHPDLAENETARAKRHRLMSQANQAYAEEDHGALEAILRDWQLSADHLPKGDVANELVRVIRLIARQRLEIQAVQARIEELKDSYLCRMKLRVDTNFSRGSDLFADLMAAAELNIAKARKRLAALKGVQEQEVPRKKSEKPCRTISFPAHTSCGTLYTRDRSSLNFSQWQKRGEACGTLQVELDQAVRLDVKDDSASKLSHLQQLGPDDLQALFLYGVIDADLHHILHLTGLEELCLSGSRFTDAALVGIAPLAGLKRLYLYQTEITDAGLRHLTTFRALQGLTSSGNRVTPEGLALIEMAMPGMKTMNIPWRR